MFIRRSDVPPIDFDGLRIVDYTAGRVTGSSLAEIAVPAGVRHKTSWSKRSDKYYYVVEGTVRFVVGDQEADLSAGDVCVVRQGERFAYSNPGSDAARLILVHTPGFDLASEVFED